MVVFEFRRHNVLRNNSNKNKATPKGVVPVMTWHFIIRFLFHLINGMVRSYRKKRKNQANNICARLILVGCLFASSPY